MFEGAYKGIGHAVERDLSPGLVREIKAMSRSKWAGFVRDVEPAIIDQQLDRASSRRESDTQ